MNKTKRAESDGTAADRKAGRPEDRRDDRDAGTRSRGQSGAVRGSQREGGAPAPGGTGCGLGAKGHGGQEAARSVTGMRTLPLSRTSVFAGGFIGPDSTITLP
ncbi:hypothetical protein GCM10010451_57840 [Streptomyces virens]|uniref:Uncharacterized protein n=1 Tax=Streptomyces virens TaxID=285572 RepID=A0ABP6Q133_9ACTN